MSLPDSPRVFYDRNPLEQVICQFRFPTILKIETELPTDFQEGIREVLPIFEEKKLPLIQKHIPAEVAELMSNFAGTSGGREYKFLSEDRIWTTTLASGFIALTTSVYERWEDFSEKLLRPFDVLIKTYSPAFFSRIGLRYRNVISRSNLGLDECDWADLLRSEIAGELSSELRETVQQAARQTTIQLDDGVSLSVRHGLSEKDPDSETCYLIDCDYYTNERTDPNHAKETLTRFNRESGKFFRWCISDKLHEAMGPTLATGDNAAE